jgi:hypothetical protein
MNNQFLVQQHFQKGTGYAQSSGKTIPIIGLEKMWMEAAVHILRHQPSIYLQRLMTTKKNR